MFIAVVFIAMTFIWSLLDPVVQSSILWVGWPIVGVVTVIQTLLMAFKLFRRQYGYKV